MCLVFVDIVYLWALTSVFIYLECECSIFILGINKLWGIHWYMFKSDVFLAFSPIFLFCLFDHPELLWLLHPFPFFLCGIWLSELNSSLN